MNKIAALSLAIFCGVCFILSLLLGLYVCQGTFLIIGAIFGIVAYNKYRRDARLAAASYRSERNATRQLQLPPPMSSSGSSHMFVPPPLQHK